MTRPQRYPHPVGIYKTAWGTWFLQLRVAGELLYLGTYDTKEEAVEAREAFREQQRAAGVKGTGRSVQAGGNLSVPNVS